MRDLKQTPLVFRKSTPKCLSRVCQNEKIDLNVELEELRETLRMKTIEIADRDSQIASLKAELDSERERNALLSSQSQGSAVHSNYASQSNLEDETISGYY